MSQASDCPHCGATVVVANRFCEACGKALPEESAGPRVLSGNALPRHQASRQALSGDLKKQINNASYALLAVGILLGVVGLVFLGIHQAGKSTELAVNLSLLIVIQLVLSAGFLGLFFWARKMPLPATIVGMVLYATLVVVNVVTTAMDSADGGAPRGFGVGCLDFIILIVLGRGIQAAVKYRRMTSN